MAKRLRGRWRINAHMWTSCFKLGLWVHDYTNNSLSLLSIYLLISIPVWKIEFWLVQKHVCWLDYKLFCSHTLAAGESSLIVRSLQSQYQYSSLFTFLQLNNIQTKLIKSWVWMRLIRSKLRDWNHFIFNKDSWWDFDAKIISPKAQKNHACLLVLLHFILNVMYTSIKIYLALLSSTITLEMSFHNLILFRSFYLLF